MRKTTIGPVIAAFVLGVPTANAVVIRSNWDPLTGTVVDIGTEVTVGASRGGFDTSTTQAMNWQAIATISSPGTVFANVTNCLEAAPDCGPGVLATLDTDVSVGGLEGRFSGRSGADLATSNLTLNGTLTDPAYASALMIFGGTEFQRLMFTTSANIDMILVDIAYSVFAEVTQFEPQSLFARAAAGVTVGDATTHSGGTGPFGLGTIDLAFFAAANAGNLFGATGPVDSALGAIGTFAVQPNVEYWVMMTAAENVLFTGLGDVNLAMRSFVDPVFSVNEAWLASFGDARPDISIKRVTTVPEPATLSLLGAGILGLLLSRRRQGVR
jgi:hypothetical protein